MCTIEPSSCLNSGHSSSDYEMSGEEWTSKSDSKISVNNIQNRDSGNYSNYKEKYSCMSKEQLIEIIERQMSEIRYNNDQVEQLKNYRV